MTVNLVLEHIACLLVFTLSFLVYAAATLIAKVMLICTDSQVTCPIIFHKRW